MTVVAAVATVGSTGAGQSDVPAAVRFTYGGDGTDTVNAVTTDAVGNIYIAGRTTSKNLPGTEHGFQKTLRGTVYNPTDGFVAKLSPDGRVIWATYLGGNDQRLTGLPKLPMSQDEARAIAVDAAGNVYVAGTTGSTDFPTTSNAFQTHAQAVAASGYDGFFAKFTADGRELSYSTYIGAVDRSTMAAAIAAGRNGDAWVLASTTSPQFPWTHDLSAGAGAAYLGHVLADGTLASWTRLGSGGDLIAGLALDRLGRPHVLTHGPPSTAGVVLTQLDDSGTRANFTWSLPIKETLYLPSVADLAIGPDGTIVIVGLAAGSLPVTAPFQPAPGGSGDAFVAALNPQGVPELLSYLGGSGAERTRPRVAVNADQLHITLDTSSFDLRTERGLVPRHPDSPLYTSANRGSSWRPSHTGLKGGLPARVTDFAFDPSRDIVYTLSEGVVLRSTDDGATWQEVRRIESQTFRNRIAIDPRDPTTLYAGDTHLYRLDRSGETVTRIRQAGAGSDFRVEIIAVSPHDSSVWIGAGTGVEVSFDRGASWERRGNVPPPFFKLPTPTSWAIDANRAGTMVIGSDSGVFGTEDHGHTWVELTTTFKTVSGTPYRPAVDAVALDPTDSRRIYAGSRHGIFVTDDRGQTWRVATRNLAVKAIAVDPHHPKDVFAAVTDWSDYTSGVIVSRDRGRTWNWSLQTRDGLTGLAAGPQGLFAAGPTTEAPFLARFNWRQGSYVPSFASYLMEGTVRALVLSPQGDSVLALNSWRPQADVVVVRIAR